MTQVNAVSGNTFVPTQSSETVHTVQHGDTLSDIARRYGTSVAELMSANPNIHDPNRIYPGQSITIPDGGRTAGASSINTVSTRTVDAPAAAASNDGGAFDYNRIAGVRGNPNVTPEFIHGVEQMAARLGTRPEYIMAVMSFETGGSFSPAQKNNAGSGATGLIQFMPNTARGLGTSTAELSRMSSVDQLRYVEQYFEPYKGRLGTLEGVYSTVLAGSPHPDPNSTLFASPSAAYNANRGLDHNGDGRITSGEATAAVRARVSGELNGSAPAPQPSAPNGGTTTPAPSHAGDYTVKRGDTLSAIAARNGVSLNALIAANPQIRNPNLIYAGQTVHIPGGSSANNAAPASYSVQSGDTLSAIAARNGVSLNALIAANPQIRNPNLIYPGQTVHIPGGHATGGTSGTQAPTPGSTTATGNNAAAIAQQFLNRNESELKKSGDLPMNPNVPSDVCCANFVSACLERAGLLPHNKHTDSVATLNSTLRGMGWRPVDMSQARPGDVVIIQGGGVSHTVMVQSNDHGKVTLIGSNNVNSDGTQRITTSGTSWAMQHGAVVLTPPH